DAPVLAPDVGAIVVELVFLRIPAWKGIGRIYRIVIDILVVRILPVAEDQRVLRNHVAELIHAIRTAHHLAGIEVGSLPAHDVLVMGADPRVGVVPVDQYSQGITEERIAEQRTDRRTERAVVGRFGR